MSKMHVLILAGGSGTRLWPLSNEDKPKQFLCLCGSDLSLLQLTVGRLLKIADKNNIHVVSSPRWKPLIEEQLEMFGFGHDAVIEEPAQKNTAPAIALGIRSLILEGAKEADTVLVCPSDHLIQDESAFAEAVETAKKAAAGGRITTFGIKPTYPETGFGYIKAGRIASGYSEVEAFVEKPDAATAKDYILSGDYYWNAGIFCFTIRDMLEAFGKHFESAIQIVESTPGRLSEVFESSPKKSIDYAVMEKSDCIACIPADVGWSDVGSWEAIYANSPKDEFGNAVMGDASLTGCKNNLIIGGSEKIVADSVESTIIVKTSDALFIAPRMS